ncbi:MULTISPECIES: TatD family hydrolase [unclassified Myroides]|uniref:TatD family hydrolase n=1 Tax=unclassified Myroides TaxID=2642485 RepID=UPI003100FA45
MKINLHTHHSTNLFEGIEIVNQYPMQVNVAVPHYSVGIHPWYIEETSWQKELPVLEEQLLQANCLAIGECGLDKKIAIPLELQIKVFSAQLLLAEKYKKAVILHLVSAYQEVIALKKELHISVPLIVHGFNKNKQVADSLIKNGFYLSFGKVLLSKPALVEVFQAMPKEKVFLETDDAKDVSIEAVYHKAMTVAPDIEAQIEANFREIFNI